MKYFVLLIPAHFSGILSHLQYYFLSLEIEKECSCIEKILIPLSKQANKQTKTVSVYMYTDEKFIQSFSYLPMQSYIALW